MAMLKKETEKLSDWRMELSIIKAFGDFPDYFDSDMIYDQIVQILMKKLFEVLHV
jgi:hypothetical protein